MSDRLETTRTEPSRIREIAVSRWWNSGDLSTPLPTSDGREATIVFRGSWSHGLGPDFQNALIDFGDGRLSSGSIEIHLSTSSWRQHGHDRDVRYNDVILHVVLDHDGSETRRADGRIVPVSVVSPDATLLAMLDTVEVDWNLVGGEVCAESVARLEPVAIRSALWRLGDERLGGKVAQISARFDDATPADLLFELIMDGLGYSSNREPMRLLARRMPVSAIDAVLALVPPQDRYHVALGLLLGAGGFLPLTPTESEILGLAPSDVSRVEACWESHGSPLRHDRLAPTSWDRVRVRPANHPLIRLSMAAALLSNSFDNLSASIVAAVRAGVDPVQLLMDRSRAGHRAGMGRGRGVAIVASAVIPYVLALAESSGDPDLAEKSSRCWERLESGEQNNVTKRALRQVAGTARIGRIGERGMQGLIQLDRLYCEPRRCMECSIAHLALSCQPTTTETALE